MQGTSQSAQDAERAPQTTQRVANIHKKKTIEDETVPGFQWISSDEDLGCTFLTSGSADITTHERKWEQQVFLGRHFQLGGRSK